MNGKPENPYAAPEQDPVNPDVFTRQMFSDIPTKQLKTLRNDSHNIRVMAALQVIAVLFWLIFFFATGFDTVLVEDSEFGYAIWAATLGIPAAFSVFTLVGLIKRTNWGRILGFIMAALMLAGFPLGTILGIFCLISLSRGGRLFGSDRLLHKDLEHEWKYRKKHKIA